MILGVLSDTHGDARRTALAMRVLERAGAEMFVHCGDIGGAGVLDEMAGRPGTLVLGNTDYPDGRLESYAQALGLMVAPDAPARLEVDGRVALLFHGHEEKFELLFDDTPRGEAVRAELEPINYILHGHTHVARNVRVGSWRVVNPGALHRAKVHTVATVDVARDVVKHWRVEYGDEELRGYGM